MGVIILKVSVPALNQWFLEVSSHLASADAIDKGNAFFLINLTPKFHSRYYIPCK